MVVIEMTEEQRQKAEANRQAALAKRKELADAGRDPWKLFKCRKVSPEHTPAFPSLPKPQLHISEPQIQLPHKFRVSLQICTPDSFSITPEPIQGYTFPGEAACLEKLRDCLANVFPTHYTQNHGGGKACVYTLADYRAVQRCLKTCTGIVVDEIPWGTFNVIEKLSNSIATGRWIPSRPEHLSDEKVDELIEGLPKSLVHSLLPFQLDGVRFGLQRGGRCLIADEMGLGKTLQAIAIAGCFMNEGSILVVCPAILRYNWAEEIERWLPSCLPSEIHLVFGHQDNPANLPNCPKVVVISYTMLHRLRKSLLGLKWALLIVDESHHVRCTKKPSEPGEIQAVLDVATKVKRIVLLSGTPSLSRPFDIFHQINMLWEGLLGKTKYDFAKTYCAVKFVRGSQGHVFQDFSKGIRLEELNVLLKQTVMIRRLKEKVLKELPPKRRQILRLTLKKSDIELAIVACKEVNGGDPVAENEDGDEQVDIDDEPDGRVGRNATSRKLSNQVIGVAKVSGFCEWLSFHPIIAETGIDENSETSHSSHKMIIFAHHHKVLDRVQEFICSKGIGFVRIDGTTFAGDRQLAVRSFQSSKEVKIAIIGILAGGAGLNLSAAQNVVFLELPKGPAHLLQAEDRAHRRNQTNAVNVYIFCAKDTSDESHWQNLNKSLQRVSSTMNGKYDAIREIEVERVSDLETIRKPDCIKENQFVESIAESPKNSSHQAFQHNEEHNHDDSYQSKHYLQIEESKFVATSGSEMNKNSIETAELNDDGVIKTDLCNSSEINFLRFEVSRYTGRIHLYSCIAGVDLRPKPLFENFQPEELESSPAADVSPTKTEFKCIKDDPKYRNATLAFIKEWNSLRPIEQKKLLLKPLQLPLSVELCCLNESHNHDSGGLLKGGSKKRRTSLEDISDPLPSTASWRKVIIGHGKKEREYEQGCSLTDEPLCKLCQATCTGNNAKKPEYFEDLFCALRCYEEYRLRTSNRYLREGLFQIERGICTNCKLNCHKLVEHLKPLSHEKRQEYIKKVAPQLEKRVKLFEKLVLEPSEGNAWHADHIIPVYRGGGECTLENMRTLCVACHADVTAAQGAERRSFNAKAKKQLKAILKDVENPKKKEDDDDDELLLIKVPGSSYSASRLISTDHQIDEKPT